MSFKDKVEESREILRLFQNLFPTVCKHLFFAVSKHQDTACYRLPKNNAVYWQDAHSLKWSCRMSVHLENRLREPWKSTCDRYRSQGGRRVWGNTFNVQIYNANSWVEILQRHVFYPIWRGLFLKSDSAWKQCGEDETLMNHTPASMSCALADIANQSQHTFCADHGLNLTTFPNITLQISSVG